jgi:hypothetical protein
MGSLTQAVRFTAPPTNVSYSRQVGVSANGSYSSPQTLGPLDTPEKNVTVCYSGLNPSGTDEGINWGDGFTRLSNPNFDGSSIAYKELPANAGEVLAPISWASGQSASIFSYLMMSFPVS